MVIFFYFKFYAQNAQKEKILIYFNNYVVIIMIRYYTNLKWKKSNLLLQSCLQRIKTKRHKKKNRHRTISPAFDSNMKKKEISVMSSCLTHTLNPLFTLFFYALQVGTCFLVVKQIKGRLLPNIHVHATFSP